MTRRRSIWILAGGLFALVACEVPYAPKWNADLFFPVRFPDVAIDQFGPVVPPTNTAFTAPLDSQVVSSGTREIFDQRIDTLKAEILFSTQTNIVGTLDISVTPVRADLFSTNPGLAVTVTVPIRVTAGDTTRVTVNTNLFRTATVLYLQSRGTMRSNTGNVLPVTSVDKLVVGLDLTASVKVSQ